MSDAAISIKRFERKVMWRERALSLLDYLALALMIGGIASASIVLYIRLRPAELSIWKIVFVVFGAVVLAAGARWFLTRAREREAAFKIDRALDLEDRIVSSRAIIERGGPQREIETALIDDAAQRLSKVDGSRVVPFVVARWHALGLIGMIALTVALMIPQKPNPQADALIAERNDIQTAGEQLEQVGSEVEKELPPESETARLAKEQAELGRALRRSTDTRAEALKKINELESRIRERHEVLANTRADEIVGLAERRLKAALAEKPKEREQNQDKATSASDASTSARNSEDAAENKKENKADNSNRSETTASNKSDENSAKPTEQQKSDQPKPAVDKSSESNADGKQPDKREQPSGDQSGNQPSSPNQNKSEGEQTGAKGEQKPEGEKSESEKPESEKPEDEKKESVKLPTDEMSKLMAEQAAKALSNQLLKKAEQLRTGDISLEDIKKLQQAAENLARDLAPIAQSKEFQQALEQLAQKVNPEQLEKVARELMKNEQLKKELEAAARMLAENRQVKELVAGLRQKFGDKQKPGEGKELARNQSSGQGDGKGKGGGDKKLEMNAPGEQLKGQGKEKKLAGQMQKKPGGEYLFLQARPGAGAVRAPYSSAYPQYRREAERAVERSRVPAHLRSLVRNYFDVINPDVEKKP